MIKDKRINYIIILFLSISINIVSPISLLADNGWNISTIDSTGDVGKYTSIAIDSNDADAIHISYYDEVNGDLKYANNLHGFWVTETALGVADNVGLFSDITVSLDHTIHVSYHNNTYSALVYARRFYMGYSWEETTIDSTYVSGLYTSIAVDDDDQIHISYHDPYNYTLKYATSSMGNWNGMVIAGGGKFASMALGSSGNFHISHAGAGLIAYTTGNYFEQNTTFVMDEVFEIEDTSIAIDSNETVHISYIVCGCLKYATNESGSWAISTVDGSGSAVNYTSIAIDSNDYIHISYYDEFNQDLKYATNASGIWDIATVDSAGMVGEYNFMAVDSNGFVHISYYDATNGDLKYASNKTETTCVCNDTELQDALDDAEDSGAHAIIQVVQGGYTGNFSYSSDLSRNITILGGYTTDCADRVVNPINTTLDAEGSGLALSLKTTAGGDIKVEGFTIKNGSNVSSSGGGLSVEAHSELGTAGDIIIANNIIKNNLATAYQGGGAYIDSFSNMGYAGTITLINNVIASNTAAAGSGGGVYIRSESNSFSGETITLTNNTITGNTAGTNGGGLVIMMDDNTNNVYNNIVWGNTAPTGGDIYLSVLSGTLVTNGFNNDYSDKPGTWDNGTGTNINADPKLSGNFHLRSKSPCIDAGTTDAPSIPATDFEGDNRVINGNNGVLPEPDIGADEYIPKTVISNVLMLLLN